MKSKSFQLSTLGLKRQLWASSNVCQRAALVLDGSLSMQGEKATEVLRALHGLLAVLNAPENKNAFRATVNRFDGVCAERLVPMRPVSEIDSAISEIELCSGRAGTNITCGLEDAERLLAESQDPEVREVNPILTLFTDGGHNTGPRPEPVADRLKSAGVTVVAVAYGQDADVGLLRRLATSPQHCFRCNDGAELRAFFAAVGETMSASIQRGVDPKQSLTAIDGLKE